MPGWQKVNEELGPEGLTVITIAIDRAEDARKWIEKTGPTHPSLIDENHRMGELYNIVNVPTIVWVDEDGRIARPNDVAFTTEKGGRYAQVSTSAQMELLRAWVKGEMEAKSDETLKSQVRAVSPEQQLARAMYGLGWWLYQRGHEEAGLEHFRQAGELAPEDFTIRRGTMRLRGANPFGPEFAAMVGKWLAKGKKYYLPLPVE